MKTTGSEYIVITGLILTVGLQLALFVGSIVVELFNSLGVLL